MEQPTTPNTTSPLEQSPIALPVAPCAGCSELPARVVRLSSVADIKPWIGRWNEMARGVPFRRWEWLECWWRHYGPPAAGRRTTRELFVLAVFDAQQSLLGLAPWYVELSATQGRVVRFLGSGEVCSEYLSLICAKGNEEIVARSLAKWLADGSCAERHEPNGEASNRWDVLKLSAVDRDDLVFERLLVHLADEGNAVHCRPGMNCWRLELPDSWDEYLAMMSKSHRKKLRRMDRDFFRSGRASVHWVHDPVQLEQALDVLVRLHQSRWKRRGRPGCFASERFLNFHREVAWRLLAFDTLRMSWLEIDGRAVAAEYHLAGDGTVYAYQSGIAPAALDLQPGHLSHLATIRRAIERGDRVFDFLRGDEPYKSHWRAAPRATLEVQVVPPRIGPRIRHGIRMAGGTVVNQIRAGWQLTRHLITD